MIKGWEMYLTFNNMFPVGKHRFSIKYFTRDIINLCENICIFSNVCVPDVSLEDIVNIIC